jgi:CheY-like chemotaxis protein
MKKYILACDDDVGIAEVIRIVLEDKGYEIKTTSNSEEVYALIEERQPDLILLDLWMPGLRGEEIVTKLKNDKKTENIPIIIISASRETEIIAKQTGANTYLNKPFDIDKLEEIVDKYIQGE